MLLQERNYRLHYDDAIEDEAKHPALSSAVGSSEHFSYAKSKSSKNRLRRSTFDLSSVSSLSTSSSDSSSCCLSSPTRKSSSLRYRGLSSSTSSSYNNNNPPSEGAASQALKNLVANNITESSLQDVRQEHNEIQEERESSPTSFHTQDSSTSSESSDMESFLQYLLEVIFLGYVVVPFLHLTITMERYLRSTFGDIHRNAGFVLASIYAPSSSVSQEPITMERGQVQQQQQQQHRTDSHEDFYGAEAILSCSSSSSSDDNTEEDEDAWGHFADFRDELADEASFIPSCSMMPLRNRSVAPVHVPPSCVTGLETLAEGREEEDEAEEDWSF